MSICLVAIVKNEAKVIKRMIDSAKPFINKWCIVDTGSTDGTQEIVRQELEDLPGVFCQREFTDFSTERNFALEKARELETDYVLVLDADEVFIALPNSTMPELTIDAYAIRMQIGNTNQVRIQLFKNDPNFKYVGRAHEVLQIPENYVANMLEGFAIISIEDPITEEQKLQKHANYAKLLEKDLEEGLNVARTIFYLAGEYKQCKQYEKALKAYQQRIDMGGWEEEVFHSKYQTAFIKRAANYPRHEIIDAYLFAYQYRPFRAEALMELASYLRTSDQYHLAYIFAKQAAEIPYPVREKLFIDEPTYVWRSLNELLMSAEAIGDHTTVLQCASKLLGEDRLPQSEKLRVSQSMSNAVSKISAK